MRSSNPVRVLVANQPRLMREIILSTICDHADIEIVGEIQRISDLDRVVEQTQPDFLIVDLSKDNEQEQTADQCRELLVRNPGLKILAIPMDRNTLVYYWMTLELRSSQFEVSEGNLLSLLRGKVPEKGTEGGNAVNGSTSPGRAK